MVVSLVSITVVFDYDFLTRSWSGGIRRLDETSCFILVFVMRSSFVERHESIF